MTWRDLFDLVIVGARKPEFFSHEARSSRSRPRTGCCRPSVGPLKPGRPTWAAAPRQVERNLGLSGDEILYVGDHMFGDVRVSKSVLRWRTALILRELEDEIDHAWAFRDHERSSRGVMDGEGTPRGRAVARRGVELQRKRGATGPSRQEDAAEALQARIKELRTQLRPWIGRSPRSPGPPQELANPIWGVLMRAGNDKSHLAFQVERYADIYTSRVSNFLHATPFVYLRSPRGSLPHDPA